MNTRIRLPAVISAVLIALLVIPSSLVLAWKPYTHNYTGSQVLADVLPDGRVTINGREYGVRPAIVQALRDWPEFYNNDFARGVFPAVADVLTNVDDASIALRHIIIEGYVGDATAGFDGNPERGPAPGGDVSDDSTPGIAYDAPHRFIYETLIRLDAGAPSTERGPLIDFFLDLRAALVAARVPAPSLSKALSAFDDTVANSDSRPV